ncbi:MAG: FAD-dependent oxidoreductase, partial [Oscillospiraceae bacterium]
GFQTNLKFGEQKRVLSLIPGLENAEFVRYGVMHRNTFLNSPKLLDNFARLKKDKRIVFAGQITGVEGYMESTFSGIMAGLTIKSMIENKELKTLPYDTLSGALYRHISDETTPNFQPMGANMGLLPPLGYKVKDKNQKYCIMAKNSIINLKKYINENF